MLRTWRLKSTPRRANRISLQARPDVFREWSQLCPERPTSLPFFSSQLETEMNEKLHDTLQQLLQFRATKSESDRALRLKDNIAKLKKVFSGMPRSSYSHVHHAMLIGSGQAYTVEYTTSADPLSADTIPL